MFIYCKNMLSNNYKDAYSSRTTPWEGSVIISYGRRVWKSMHLCCVQLDSTKNVTEWPDNRFRRICRRTFTCCVWTQMFLLRAGYYCINKGNFLEKKSSVSFPMYPVLSVKNNSHTKRVLVKLLPLKMTIPNP